jgi:hypothetical protein
MRRSLKKIKGRGRKGAAFPHCAAAKPQALSTMRARGPLDVSAIDEETHMKLTEFFKGPRALWAISG